MPRPDDSRDDDVAYCKPTWNLFMPLFRTTFILCTPSVGRSWAVCSKTFSLRRGRNKAESQKRGTPAWAPACNGMGWTQIG